jgi:hypothetical protein
MLLTHARVDSGTKRVDIRYGNTGTCFLLEVRKKTAGTPAITRFLSNTDSVSYIIQDMVPAGSRWRKSDQKCRLPTQSEAEGSQAVDKKELFLQPGH